MITKKDLRKNILNIRNNMTSDEVNEKSKIIINKLINLEEYKESKTVFIYMDFKNEVKTYKLIEKMFMEGKRVVIPYTDTVSTVIIPTEIKDLESDLVKCDFGYMEPKKETVIPFKIDEIDLIIVPGLVFDKKLNRIGFGKGYYDRILCQKGKKTKMISLAYEFQVLEEVPTEEHDIKMDMIITEKNIFTLQ